jgi:acetyl-CoA synthetase
MPDGILTGLTGAASAEAARANFSWDQLWTAFDGNEERLNITHECLDRHDTTRIAARVAYADGRLEELSFGQISEQASRFAHLLEDMQIGKGDRVGVMVEPSLAFYAAIFGTIKRGAVAVPLYSLFGPDAIRDRLDDCAASLLVTDRGPDDLLERLPYRLLRYDAAVDQRLRSLPTTYTPDTAARDLAVLQYTSGTSRQLAEAVPHDHRSIVTLMRSALYALGLEISDRYFCPSSPAWGHGLWHGTIAPWSLGAALGTYSGRFSVDRLVDGLTGFQITNLAAASTIYRMLLRSGRLNELRTLAKASYTGEELDAGAQKAWKDAVGVPVSGMYGTTETGVIIGNYPGFSDYEPRLGALGKPLPGCEVTIRTVDGSAVATGETGEISIRRRSSWFGAKDLGSCDADGYFWYAGRADDVIIAAGWTISPLEVERALLSHSGVREAAVIGIPDEVKGHVVKAFLVADQSDDAFLDELKHLVRRELSPHEYPREIEVVDRLPRTANGKINRRALRPADERREGKAS